MTSNNISFLPAQVFSSLAIIFFGTAQIASGENSQSRPNILFAIADDWGWPHAGAYGDPVVQTPTFDRLSQEGVLLTHAFVSSPSCTPSRSAILTGQWHWRLGPAANLHCIFPDEWVTYPERLQKAGYSVGAMRKGWGPGRPKTQGRPLAGKLYPKFQNFLDQLPPGKPFCFWLGSPDPHRPYQQGSGKARGMDLNKIRLAKCFPDVPVIRSDVADYYWEVERFDRLVGNAVKLLEEMGEMSNTLVVMTGDHGMPFPRGKSNLYDSGTRVPLAMCLPAQFPAGRTVDDFVSLTDLAPTFLQLAGLSIPAEMTGRSLVDLLASDKSGQVDPMRKSTLVGKERHVPAQEAPNLGGYPCRALRTHRWLYIRNYQPDRWPAGTPDYQHAAIPGGWYADCDNGPTKTYMVKNREKDPQHRKLYQLAFGKRPAEELYDLKSDPEQLHNVIDLLDYADDRERLAAQLQAELKKTGDPRSMGALTKVAHGEDPFDHYPYLGGAPKHPDYQPPLEDR